MAKVSAKKKSAPKTPVASGTTKKTPASKTSARSTTKASKKKTASTAGKSPAKVAARKAVIPSQEETGTKVAPARKVTAKRATAKKMSATESTPDEKDISATEPKKKTSAVKKTAAKKTSAKKVAAKKSSAAKSADAAAAKTSASAKKTAAKAKKVSDSKASAAAVRARAATIQANSAEVADIGDVVDKNTVVPYERDKSGHYMDDAQLKHFSHKLTEWKQQLMEEVDRTVGHMKDDATNFPDPNDRATQEEEFSLELRTRDRERKLIKKINEAQKRIDDDEYGYCETCGIEIGVNRLEARPTAELCIDCKTLEEIRERQTA